MSKLYAHALRALLPALLLSAAIPVGAQIPSGDIRIHYHRPDGIYSGWTVYAFDNTTEANNYNGGPVQVTGTDSYGAYFDVGVTSGANVVGIIIHNPTATGGDQKDPGPNTFVNPAAEGNEYWAISGIAKLYTSVPNLTNPTALLPGYARIHYFRPDGNYSNWTVYAFNDTEEANDYNDGPTFQTGSDSYGAYFDIKLNASPADLGFIVHNVSTGTKDPGSDMHLTQFSNGQGQAWVISGDATVYNSPPSVIPSASIRIHYHRPDGNYAGWTVYAFDNTTENTNNYGGGPVQATGTDSFGAYFDVGITSGATLVGIIIHNPTAAGGDQKDPGPNIYIDQIGRASCRERV